LYFELDKQIGKFNQTKDALTKSLQESKDRERQRRRALVDLAHQLKNPLEQAKLKSESIVSGAGGAKVPKSILELRGLCRRAWRVSNGMRFLAELQDGRTMTTNRAPVNSDDVFRMLHDLMEDATLLTESYRNISPRVFRRGFSEIDSIGIKMDLALIEQALINVIDNAFKYSFANTVVEAYGSRTGSGRFSINIKNVGLAIKSSEAALCKQREWRSDLAKSVTSEGSGIGLWIVDEIMKAHDGYLEIVPTTTDNQTEVKLIF
jgi:signal transduction histidine kinase